MKVERVFFLLVAICNVAASLYAQTGGTINVEDFGASANGAVDNTGPITRAVAALRSGQTLYFPCTGGDTYTVRSPLDFGKLAHVRFAGGANTCSLTYVGTSPQPYAFSFVGASTIQIDSLSFHAPNRGVTPATVLLLGRTGTDDFSGLLRFNNVRVEGFATKALVYSIASEQNVWQSPSLFLRGGGALYAFYTSSSDDLRIYNLPTASNLSLWMHNFSIVDETGGGPTHVLIYDGGWNSGAGNHTFRDGYLGSVNGTGFVIHSGAGAISWMGLTIDSIRFENGYEMFTFAGGGAFGDIAITNNKSDGPTRYLINMPSLCYSCTFIGNNVANGRTTTSVFGRLENSFVSENYPFTVGTTVNSVISNRMTGLFQIGSPTGSAPACSASTEGAMQYVKGQGSVDGAFRICQWRSGGYGWVTH